MEVWLYMLKQEKIKSVVLEMDKEIWTMEWISQPKYTQLMLYQTKNLLNSKDKEEFSA
jgi:hypothetical protein